MIITLTTDFGYRDPFVGIMKGVIYGINPQAQVVDLSHGIAAQDITAAALLLSHSVPYFPRETIHVVVVDPGVGSTRRALLLESDGIYLIGPDNGVLSVATELNRPTRIVNLSKSDYRLQPTSSTFHGRDIFAPAAAYLSLGVAPEALGETVDNFIRLSLPKVLIAEGTLNGEIIYIDAFGNLFTNIRADDLRELSNEPVRIILGDLSIPGLAPSYAAVKPGNYVALINSWGLLEIAVCQESAQKRSGAQIADKVLVRSAH